MSTTKSRRRKRKQRALRALKRTPRRPSGYPDRNDFDDDVTIVELVEFTVTEEPMPDPYVRRLPRPVQRRIEAITEAVVGEGRAVEYIEELESLVQQYPDVPKLQNYLSLACELSGRSDEARAWTRRTMQQFPDYVFALSNCVRYCLHDGNVAEAGRVLDGRYLISQVVRDRQQFHVSEIVAYQGAVAEYLAVIGKYEAAQPHLDMLLEVAPERPQVQQLARQLCGGPLRRLMAALRR